MMWQILDYLAEWLATPDGANTAFGFLAYLALIGINGRVLALLALMLHLVLLMA